MPIHLSDDTISDLWERVRESREFFRDKQQKRLAIDRALFEGRHYLPILYDGQDPWDGFKQPVINYTAANIEIKAASLSFQPPKFTAQPEDMADLDPDQARLMPIVLSERVTRTYDASGAHEATKAALLDKLAMGGVGICMTLWEEGEDDPFAPQDPELIAHMEELARNPGIDAADLELPTPRTEGGPTTIRIDPHDFIIDPTVAWHNWRDADFIGRIYTASIEEMKAAGVPGADDLAGVGAIAIENQEFNLNPTRELFPDVQDEYPYAFLVEVFFRRVFFKRGYVDEEGTKYPKGFYPVRMVWATEKPDQPLRQEVWPFNLRDKRNRRRYPFHLLFNRKVPDRFWAQSDCQVMEEQQRLLNRARGIEATAANDNAKTKFQYRKGDVTPDGLTALESDEPFVGVELSPQAPLGGAITPIMTSPVKPEVEALGEHALRDMSELSGVTEAARGAAIEGAKTATEANLINNNSAGRAAEDQAEWEAFLEDVADVQYQFLLDMEKTGDRLTVPIPQELGGNGGPQPVTIGDEHNLPAKITIITGSTQQQDKNGKIQALLGFINEAAQVGVLATNMNPRGKFNSTVLFEMLAGLMDIDTGNPALYNTDEFLQAAAEMAQEQMAAQQQQAMLAQGGPTGASGGPAPGATPPASASGSQGPVPPLPPGAENLPPQVQQALQDPGVLDHMEQLMGGHGP